jgi:hypothetical protein
MDAVEPLVTVGADLSCMCLNSGETADTTSSTDRSGSLPSHEDGGVQGGELFEGPQDD